MFETVLVASRGPVARAVVHSCQRLGVRAVTVHSDADADALHVTEADDSVLVGPAEPEQSYLDPRRVVEAARQAGAQAVHPGAGALAVDPQAARAVREAGLVWVGAAPEVLEAARALAGSGRGGPDGSGRRTVTVLVLAPAGAPPVAVCDLERVDAADPCAVVAAPARGLGTEERREVGDAAVGLVAELGVRGVAAVEVLPGRPARATGLRCALPVEHPVAALVADVDPVEEQLRAAGDEPTLWRPPGPVPASALLLRVYALDLGLDGAHLTRWAEPAGVRVDSGYREGDLVPSWYDPLLATLTVAGPSGGDVLSRARAALRELVVEGPRTNVPALRAQLDDPSFAAA